MHMNSTVGHDDTNSMEPQFVLMIEKKHLNHALGDLSPQRGSLERDVSHNSRKFRSVYIYICCCLRIYTYTNVFLFY